MLFNDDGNSFQQWLYTLLLLGSKRFESTCLTKNSTRMYAKDLSPIKNVLNRLRNLSFNDASQSMPNKLHQNAESINHFRQKIPQIELSLFYYMETFLNHFYNNKSYS